MGCNYYAVYNPLDDDFELHFSDSDDVWGCLCTFPYNDGDKLDAERVRSLALFGAAVVLASRGDLENGFLPYAVPQWIQDEISRVVIK